jgi:predicted DNA-binding ribbon-helix-helix protein
LESRRDRKSRPTSLVIRNIIISGRRTTVRVEPVMWEALVEIAQQQDLTVHQLATKIGCCLDNSSLTSAIRAYIVNFYRSGAAETSLAAGSSADDDPGGS